MNDHHTTHINSNSGSHGNRGRARARTWKPAAVVAAGIFALFALSSCGTTPGGYHGGPGGGFYPGTPGNDNGGGGSDNDGGDNGGGNQSPGDGNDNGGGNQPGNGNDNGGGNNNGGVNAGGGGSVRPDIGKGLIPDRLQDLFPGRNPGVRPPGGAQPDPSPIDTRRPGLGRDIVRNPNIGGPATMPGGPRVTQPVSRVGNMNRVPDMSNIGSRARNRVRTR